MRAYHLIHSPGNDPGGAARERVADGLGRALAAQAGLQALPVRWNAERRTIIGADEDHCGAVAADLEPVLASHEHQGQPIAPGAGENGAGDWLVFSAVPPRPSGDVAHAAALIGELVAAARQLGLRSAAVIDPLQIAEDGGGEGISLAAVARALRDADLLLPVSQSAGARLADWFEGATRQPLSWPRIAPVPLPEEIAGVPRRAPPPAGCEVGDVIRFLAFGTICRRNNQLRLLEAFNKLILRRPELPLLLDLAGDCEPELVGPMTRQVRGAGGRARLFGEVADDRLFRLVAGARATISLSPGEHGGFTVGNSLWLGTPCLCSKFGTMADVAGGVVVDPRDGDAIAAAIERLATDYACYRRLLGELAQRQFRTWADYGADVLAEIKAAMAGTAAAPRERPPPPGPQPDACRAHPEVPAFARDEVTMPEYSPAFERQFTITADELSCHDAYLVGAKNTLRAEGAIAFAAERHGTVAEDVLFFGPYIGVERGVYLLAFEGELDGRLQVLLTCNKGTPVKELTIDSFGPLVCVALTSALEDFEIVGLRTPGLKRMRLEAISVHYIDPSRPGEEADDVPGESETVDEEEIVGG